MTGQASVKLRVDGLLLTIRLDYRNLTVSTTIHAGSASRYGTQRGSRDFPSAAYNHPW